MTSFNGRQEFNAGGGRGEIPRIEVVLDGEEVFLAEKGEVKIGVLTVPSAFSLSLGTGKDVAKLLEKFPPNTRFVLRVDGKTLMTGFTDGRASRGKDGTVTIQGRDVMAQLQRSCLLQEDSYKDDTYSSLVRKVLDSVHMNDDNLLFSNRQNRAAMVGKDIENFSVKGKAPAAARRDTQTLAIGGGATAGGAIQKHIQSKLGEKGLEFLQRHLNRAGLFLWASADGDVILSEPNGTTAPLYRIQRSQGAVVESSDVEDSEFNEDTVDRFSEIHIYTRGETKKAGRATSITKVTDSEMVEWGFDVPRVLRDVDADTPAKAEFIARREMAIARRKSLRLSYTLSGHTHGTLLGDRAVMVPDTIVEVKDERYGLDENFYIESVTYQLTPRRTVASLMRPRDLIFGDEPT